MKIEIKKLPKSRVKLSIEAPATDVAEYFERAYKKLSQQVEIKGFRNGKAPRMMVINKIGQNRYNSETLNLALPGIYVKAIQEKKLIPIGQPAVSIKKFAEDEPFSFEAEVDILPKIKLGDYKKIKVDHKTEKFEVKLEDVEKVVKRLRYQSAKYKDVSRPAKKGDKVEIEFKGFIDKVQQEKYSSKNYPLILGEGIMIPGFEDNLAGMKKDEVKKFKQTINKKNIDFEVKMLDVKEVELPELNNEFVKKFDRKSVDDLKGAIKESILKEKEMKDRQKLEAKVLDEVIKKVQMEIPEILINQDITRRIQHLQKQTGPGFSEFLKKSGKSMADLQKDIRPSAERSVKIGLVLGEISKDLGFVKIKPKTEEEQRAVVKKTIDKLIEFAVK